jgi:retinol dehydrogenase-14
MGASVVMVGGNRGRGEAALAEIKEKSPNASVDLMLADVSSQEQIYRLADEFKRAYPRVDVLKASAPSRIVNVSSGEHTNGTIDFDNLQGEEGYKGAKAYSQSKLANVLFTYEPARRLEGTGVTANCLHPRSGG